MKIVSASVYSVHLPLEKPFQVSYQMYKYLPSVILKIHTDTGLIGYGEATPDQHVTGETLESTFQQLIHYLLPAIIGLDPKHFERIHYQMNKTIYGAPSAKAAVDMACFDLFGKEVGQPVYELLGGRFHEYLNIPAVIGLNKPDHMAEEAEKAVNKGYKEIKMKIGADLQTDILRINAVSKAAGKFARIRVDANQGLSWNPDVISLIETMKKEGITYLEQPVEADDEEQLYDFKVKSGIPIIADESVHNTKDLKRLIRNRAAEVINIKLMKCGGLYPALKMIHQSELANVKCMIGSMIESSIATAAGAHLAMSKQSIVMNDLCSPLLFSKDISSLNYLEPYLYLGEQSGLGLCVNEENLEKLTVMKDTISI